MPVPDISVAYQAPVLYIGRSPAHAVDLISYPAETLRVLREHVRDLNLALDDAIHALEVEQDLIRRIEEDVPVRPGDIQAHRRLTSTSRYSFTPSDETYINLTADVVPFNVFMLLVDYLTFPSLKAFTRYEVLVKRTVKLLETKDLRKGWYSYHQYLQNTYPDRAVKFWSELCNHRNKAGLLLHKQHHIGTLSTPAAMHEGPRLETSKYQTPYCTNVVIQKFQNLDNDSRDFAAIVVFLGGVVSEYIIKNGTAYSLVPVLTDARKLQLATKNLLSLRFIILDGGLFLADPDLQLYIKEVIPNSMIWQAQASKIFFCSINQHMDSYFHTDLERSQFQHILSYFNKPNFLQYFSHVELTRVVEVCMLYAKFSSPFHTTATAETIMKAMGYGPELSARLKIRKETFGVSWHFLSLKDQHPKVAHLLTLLCFATADCHIPTWMVERLKTSQRRWSQVGEMEDMPKYGFLYDAASSIESLIHPDFIWAEAEKETWSINPSIWKYVKVSTPNSEVPRLQLEALSLVCYVFPRHPDLTKLYGNVSRSLLPLLQHVLTNCETLEGLCHPFGEIVVAALLSASRFLDLDWKQFSVKTAQSVIKSSTIETPEWLYLQKWADQRELAFSPTGPGYVQQVLQLRFTPTDQRSNAQLGELLLLAARAMIMRDELKDALSILNQWGQFEANISTQETPLLHQKDFSIARIIHLQGNFLPAVEKLLYLRRVVRWDSLHFSLIESRLADAYCELGKPAEAEKITLMQLNNLEKFKWEHLRMANDVWLSLAEAYLEQGKFLQAENIYRRLEGLFKKKQNLHGNDQTNFMRVLCGLARRFHLDGHWLDALSSWKDALAIAKRWGWRDRFIEMMISASISHANLELNRVEKAEKYAARANNLCSYTHMEYWLPLLGTKWPRFLKDRNRLISLTSSCQDARGATCS